MSNDDRNHQSVLGSWTRRAAAALRTLMNKRIQRITLTHWLLLVIWVTSLWIFTSHYRQLYANSAVFATLCTNILLFGISDILAQSIACFYSYHVDPIPQILNDTFHHVQNNRDVENGGGYESDELSIFNDFTSEHSSYTDNDDYPELDRPLATFKTDTFDFFRWGCFMFWGFFISFFQAPWYKFLNFFYNEDPTVVQVFERVLSDQLLYS
ncbi:CPS_collapsed_G0054200.mRNA.1.CDS.1 [Saccharomyces cerevisiae]|nr:CPS_collapsed_G0054200.mRNA.1.CDS.1 [Saccharomyces cerevisiae]